MKKEEFNEGMNHLDPEIIEQYSLQKDNLRQKNRSRSAWLRFGSLAACFAVIAATLIAVPRLREFNPGPDIGSETTKDPSSGSPEATALPDKDPINSKAPDEGPNTPVESDHLLPGITKGEDDDPEIDHPNDETVPKNTVQAAESVYYPGEDSGVSAPETAPVPDYAFEAYISDPKFAGYELSGQICDPESVGEYYDEITLTFRYGPEKADVSAKAYTVNGMDSELCLCVRYSGDGTYYFYNDVLDSEAYYFISAQSYSFDSLDALRAAFSESDIYVPDYANGYTSNGDIVTNIFLSSKTANEVKQLLSVIDGEKSTAGFGIGPTIKAESTEYIGISFGFTNNNGYYLVGRMTIYDMGYLYYSALGGQLFEIGTDGARLLIDTIKANSTPQKYDWIESEGELFPVIYDNNAEYESFYRALVENKLYDQLYFEHDIVFWEQVYGATYHEFKIPQKHLTEITKLLYDADGPAVKTDEIPGFLPEENLFHPVRAVVLTQLWENGDSMTVTVYDCGHVKLNGVYYFIGTDFTDKIIYAVYSCISDGVESEIPSETAPFLSAESSCDLPAVTSPTSDKW